MKWAASSMHCRPNDARGSACGPGGGDPVGDDRDHDGGGEDDDPSDDNAPRVLGGPAPESEEQLSHVRPFASGVVRVGGITPAALAAIMVHLKAKRAA